MLQHPNNDEIEISLFGTGGGYGESIAIHLGDRVWIVVDSCKNPKTNETLPLDYLRSIGVNLRTEVSLIVCSHWHDDHILGISHLVQECNSAQFCFAQAIDLQKFLLLVNLDGEKIKKAGSLSSTVEFNRCLESAQSRILFAAQDRILFNHPRRPNTQVISLSPSDATIQDYNLELSQLITEFGTPNKKIVIETPNDKSVALLLKLGESRAILGADLEVSSDERKGWMNILKNSQAVDSRSSYFKVPHHGSINGYHANIWNLLLEKEPSATLTPWNRHTGLPTAQMADTLRSHTRSLFITSPPKLMRTKKRDPQVEKLISSLGYLPKEVTFERGIIRSRLARESLTWQTDLFDAAIRL